MGDRIRFHWELDVYRLSVDAAMQIFERSKAFPREEAYSLTDQAGRSSRSVCANTAEGWRRRKYEKVFIDKLNEAEGEAAETQVWLEFAVKCKYLDREAGKGLHESYNQIIGKLVNMANNPKPWILRLRK
ncbi:MAG: four helix bundle protein [Proteobacteria bacterium]|nr:MAG: four helix bundle protein [Pseudomonadota bacterium]